MARNLDIIIYGATGFTGKHTIPILQKILKSSNKTLKWGVSGRNEKKLKEVLAECSKEGEPSMENIPVIVADVGEEEALNAMAKQTKIVINCAGPYRFYGEPVVKACVNQGTHYVDVSGEPQFIEQMQLKYDAPAKEKGIYIINACGFDSIPCDVGAVFLQEKFGGTVNSIITFLQGDIEGGESLPGPSVNYGTWESAVYGLAHGGELRDLRRQLNPQKLPSFKPKLISKTYPHKSEVVDGWVLPFMGADKSIMKRTQRYLYEKESKRPAQVDTFFIVESFFNMVVLVVGAAMFMLFTKFEMTRNLLLKYPEFFSFGYFSHKQPSEEKLNKSVFSITLYGEGWKESLADPKDEYSTPPNKAMIVKVKGRNPGYGATCVALAIAGIVVITETNKLPPGGGVYPPGAAFAKTSLIEQLNNNGLTFEVVAEKELK